MFDGGDSRVLQWMSPCGRRRTDVPSVCLLMTTQSAVRARVHRDDSTGDRDAVGGRDSIVGNKPVFTPASRMSQVENGLVRQV